MRRGPGLARGLSLGEGSQRKAADCKRATSAAFDAFQQAGLVGTGQLSGVSADKKAVRECAMQRIRRSAAA